MTVSDWQRLSESVSVGKSRLESVRVRPTCLCFLYLCVAALEDVDHGLGEGNVQHVGDGLGQVVQVNRVPCHV